MSELKCSFNKNNKCSLTAELKRKPNLCGSNKDGVCVAMPNTLQSVCVGCDSEHDWGDCKPDSVKMVIPLRVKPQLVFRVNGWFVVGEDFDDALKRAKLIFSKSNERIKSRTASLR